MTLFWQMAVIHARCYKFSSIVYVSGISGALYIPVTKLLISVFTIPELEVRCRFLLHCNLFLSSKSALTFNIRAIS